MHLAGAAYSATKNAGDGSGREADTSTMDAAIGSGTCVNGREAASAGCNAKVCAHVKQDFLL